MSNVPLSPLAAAVRKKTRALLSPTLLTLALSSHLALAQPVALDIPAQSLTGALNALAQQANLQLLYSPDAVKNVRSPALKGNLEPAEALNRLLQGSGLTYELKGNSVTLRPAASDASLELSPTTISGQGMNPTTEDSGSYTSNVATIGKGQHKLKDIPQSVSIVTRKAMDDQNLNTLSETLEKTTGVTTFQSPSGGKYVYSRGFEVDTYQYDGVPMDRRYYAIGSSFISDTLFYDRVEIIRGANGLLQGAGSPSAAINLVRKKPKADPFVSITASAGSWDTYRETIDAGAPLTADGSLRGRVALGREDRNYFYDEADSHKNLAYAVLEYDLAPSTVISAGASVEDSHATPFFGGLPRNRDGSAIDASRDTYTGADWNKWDSKTVSYFSDLTHDFNDDWRLKAAATYMRETNYMLYSFGRGAITNSPQPGDGMSSRAYLYDFENINKAADINLTGKFRNLGREHEIVVGANASDLKTDDQQAGLLNLGAINLYNPVSPAKPTDAQLYGTSYAANTHADIKQTGLYSVLRYKLLDPLTLVAGVRSSNYEYEYNYKRLTTGVSNDPTKSKETGEVSPYGGLIYELTPEWSAYVSYADIFKPQTEISLQGAALKPIVGSNYELGLKGELYEGRLNTSFALFRIDQENRAQYDYGACPDADIANCYVSSGKVRSEGFDAEISGEVVTGLQLLAGYTYVHTEYMDVVNDDEKGNTGFSYTPKHLFRTWAEYTLPGNLKQWTVGAGGTVQSSNYHSNYDGTGGVDKIEQAGYAVWNARVGYQINKNFNVSINGNNLADKKYYSTIGWLNADNHYGDPRNYTLTLKADF